MLTTNEIAKLLGIGIRATNLALHRAGITPVRIIGRSHLYAESVIDTLRSRPKPGHPFAKREVQR